MQKEVQIIALDIGRRNCKVYSIYKGKEYKVLFSSVISDGRHIQFDKYDDPIFINVDNANYFVGNLAEKEGYTVTRNSSDSKISLTVKILIHAAILKVAKAPNVRLMLGVPSNQYRKSVLLKVIECYKDKYYTVRDNITNEFKTVYIEDVDIYREADAICIDVLNGDANGKDILFVSVGFKTTECSYYDKYGNYVDRYSTTIFYGHKDMLAYVQNKLRADGTVVDVIDIDSNVGDYDILKSEAYELASETLVQKLEEIVPNLDNVDVVLSGGTIKHLTLDERFNVTNDPMMNVSKGLFKVGEMLYE